jgi:hypothetical protein
MVSRSSIVCSFVFILSSRNSVYYCAGRNAVLREPALIGLQRIGDLIRAARNNCFVQRVHRFDLENFPCRVDVRNREWDLRISHPKRGLSRLFKDEKHSSVRRQRITKHQPVFRCLRRVCNFGCQWHIRDLQFGSFQTKRGRVRSLWLTACEKENPAKSRHQRPPTEPSCRADGHSPSRSVHWHRSVPA